MSFEGPQTSVLFKFFFSCPQRTNFLRFIGNVVSIGNARQHNIFEVHPRGSTRLWYFPLDWRIVFHYAGLLHFISPFTSQWNLGLFPLLGYQSPCPYLPYRITQPIPYLKKSLWASQHCFWRMKSCPAPLFPISRLEVIILRLVMRMI